MNQQKTSQTEKLGAPAIGNAVAFFVVLWAVSKGIVDTDDKAEAVAMGGAIASYLLLQVRQLFAWLGGLIEKIASDN